jgi:hypothetical protein
VTRETSEFLSYRDLEATNHALAEKATEESIRAWNAYCGATGGVGDDEPKWGQTSEGDKR